LSHTSSCGGEFLLFSFNWQPGYQQAQAKKKKKKKNPTT
jgi:hypothetical protein